MLQQFVTRCSDVINLKRYHRRRCELSPLGSWSKNFENLPLGDLEDRYSTFINYDPGQAYYVGKKGQCRIEIVGAHADPRIAFYVHEAIQSLLIGTETIAAAANVRNGSRADPKALKSGMGGKQTLRIIGAWHQRMK